MTSHRTKIVTGSAALVAVGALAALMMGQTSSRPAGKEPPLARQPADAARMTYELLVVEPPKQGAARADPEQTYTWSRRWMDAEQDAAADRPAALVAAEAHLARMRELAQRSETLYQSGQTSAAEVAAAKFYRLDAEWSVSKYRTK